MTLSQAFGDCVANKQDAKGTQQQEERPALFKAEVSLFCTGVFLNKDSGAVQAVTAVVVAIFTVLLTRTTRRQVSVAERQTEIADRQLRTLEVLERPFIFPIIEIAWIPYIQSTLGVAWVYYFCWKYNLSRQHFSPYPLEANYTEKGQSDQT